MPLPRLSLRLYFLALFVLCIGEMCFGVIYLQLMGGVKPCPMCIMQRYAMLGIGLVALIGVIHNRAAIVYGTLVTLIALAGGWVAARQSWLQLYPPQIAECGPGLDYMLKIFTLSELLPVLFWGEGDCSDAGWTFLGLSIANWGLITFAGIVVVTPLMVWRLRRAKCR